MNYVFYDFETTGLDTKFSQPIQIAAIAVDENFNVKLMNQSMLDVN